MQEYIDPSSQTLQPTYIRSTAKSIGIPDDAVEEGGFWYWLDGEAPFLHIMCAGAGSGPFEIQDQNAEYPDEIHRRRREVLAAYESGQ